MNGKAYAILFLFQALVISAGAHSGRKVFPIPELTDEMLDKISLQDVSIDEWYNLLGEPTMTLLDFKYARVWSLDPSNLDFRIWLAWHDASNRVYVAVVCSDDVYKNNHDYEAEGVTRFIQAHDSILFAVDADHSGGGGHFNNTPEEEIEIIDGETQRYYAIASTPSGPTLSNLRVNYFTGKFGWMVFPPYGDAGGGVYGENPTISMIKLYVSPFDRWEGFHSRPEEVVFSDLSAGQVIGFAFILYDWDEENFAKPLVPEPIQTDDPDIDIEHLRADIFLDGMLLPAYDGTSVQSITWGKIRAAFDRD